MSWKDITVHLDGSAYCEARIGVAAEIARRNSARLTALYEQPRTDPRIFADPAMGVETLDALNAERQEQEATTHRIFDTVAREFALVHDWMSVDRQAHSRFLKETHYADLLVTGQTAPDSNESDPEPCVLGSGRPTLVVPHIGVRSSDLRRMLVAWNDTRECTRAVHDALPLLSAAEQVHVMQVVGREAEIDATRGALDGLIEHLARHDIEATPHVELGGSMQPAEVILSRAADLQADAIVMGAYGHSRLREWVLGGATRDIFAHMTVPVMMSH